MGFPLQKQGFTLIEILVAITLGTILLSIVTASYSSYIQKTNNSINESRIQTLYNLLLTETHQQKQLPIPEGNVTYYHHDGRYAYTKEQAYSISGFFTDSMIQDFHIPLSPRDANNNNYFGYGIVPQENTFELATVIKKGPGAQSRVIGTYLGKNYFRNLIRNYNSYHFVYDASKEYFPYPPEYNSFQGYLIEWTGTVLLNSTPITKVPYDIMENDTITVFSGGYALIYFSNGRQIIVGDQHQQTTIVISKLSHKSDTFFQTSFRIFLQIGTIWSMGSKTQDEGETYEIATKDVIATVRGTSFGITKKPTTSYLTLLYGNIEVAEWENPEENLLLLFQNEHIPKRYFSHSGGILTITGGISYFQKWNEEGILGIQTYRGYVAPSTYGMMHVPKVLQKRILEGWGELQENIIPQIESLTINEDETTLTIPLTSILEQANTLSIKTYQKEKFYEVYDEIQEERTFSIDTRTGKIILTSNTGGYLAELKDFEYLEIAFCKHHLQCSSPIILLQKNYHTLTAKELALEEQYSHQALCPENFEYFYNFCTSHSFFSSGYSLFLVAPLKNHTYLFIKHASYIDATHTGITFTGGGISLGNSYTSKLSYLFNTIPFPGTWNTAIFELETRGKDLIQTGIYMEQTLMSINSIPLTRHYNYSTNSIYWKINNEIVGDCNNNILTPINPSQRYKVQFIPQEGKLLINKKLYCSFGNQFSLPSINSVTIGSKEGYLSTPWKGILRNFKIYLQ